MSQLEKQFSAIQRCDHCGVQTPLEILSRTRREKLNDDGVRSPTGGIVFELLVCPVCDEVTLRRCVWEAPRETPSDIEFQTLYPEPVNQPAQVHHSFRTAYATARNFRRIDPEAYGVMLSHLAVIHECNRKKRI